MSEERCDVAVIGAGLVGLSLAYELACLGASVTVIDAGHPGRATDAGAGILSPATSMETDEALWPFLRQAGAHYPALLQRMAVRRRRRRRDGLRPLRHALPRPAAERGRVVRPLRRARAPPRPGEITEITPEEASSLFPPLGPVHRVLHAPGFGPGRRPRHGRRAAPGGDGARRRVRRRARRTASWPAAGRRDAATSRRSRWRVTRTWRAPRLPSPVAPGPRRPASGSARGCPSAPPRARSCISASSAETEDWPIVQPLLTHYLVPWPGGRVACGGTFEAGAGFSVSVTAAGPPRAAARVPDRSRPDWTARPTSRRGSGCGPRRPTIAPSSAGCRAGATPGWRPDTAPTACCRARISARVLAHAMAGVALPADEAPLPDSFDPGRFA